MPDASDMKLRMKNSDKADQKLKKRKLSEKRHSVGIPENNMRSTQDGDYQVRIKKKKSCKGEIVKQDINLMDKNSNGQEKSSKLDASPPIADAEMVNSSKAKKSGRLKVQKQKNGMVGNLECDNGTLKSKRAGKGKKGQRQLEKEAVENKSEIKDDDVYQISSGDEDCSQGMNKWLNEYHQRRPGLKILQQRIDDFIIAYDEKDEQARKEREAQAAEGGWTVVVHNKGRKKTTELESGIAVGSVSQAAVMGKMAKKKEKIALDFYSFQRREAKRNELMMLQSKFEEDKKRIQQLRAARKFKPY